MSKLHRVFGVLFLLYFLPISSFSQKFKPSLQLGLNASQISGDNTWGYVKPGISAGGNVATTLSDNWEFELGLYYNQKGSKKYPNRGPGGAYMYELFLNYAEIPLSFHYVHNGYRFFSGVSVGRLLYSYEGDEQGEIIDDREFKNMEFSFQLGLVKAFSEKWNMVVFHSNSIIPVRGLIDGKITYQQSGNNPFVYIYYLGQYSSFLNVSVRYNFLNSSQ